MKSILHKNALPLGLGALLLTGIQAKAEEKGYVLARSALPPAGVVMTRTQTGGTTDLPVTISTLGQVVSGLMSQKKSTTEVTTVLSPDKFTQEITADEEEGTMTIAGNPSPIPPQTNPLKGLAITFERKGDTWIPSLASGGSLTEEQLKRISKDRADRPFETDLVTWGTEARKPGDKWQVDTAKLPTFVGMDHPTGTISYEFVEIKEVDGLSCASIKSTFDVTGSPAGEQSGKMKMHLAGEAGELRSIECLADIDVSLKAQLDIGIDPEKVAKEQIARLQIKGPFTMNSKTVIKKP